MPKLTRFETEPVEPGVIHWKRRVPGSGDWGNLEPVVIVRAKEPARRHTDKEARDNRAEER